MVVLGIGYESGQGQGRDDWPLMTGWLAGWLVATLSSGFTLLQQGPNEGMLGNMAVEEGALLPTQVRTSDVDMVFLFGTLTNKCFNTSRCF